ncbi:uncharacterized protein LOC134280200 [Saccostrea cucullata]|uniref:uncharacterized protein LOC134280200 n=1 Tax=Saccostrea cuccullata TaxID=36930 RepID=UPI002ED0F685
MFGFYLALVLLPYTTKGETPTGSCKDILKGYLTGQLSSVLGAYQIEALKEEFKSFTYLIEKSMKKFKGQVNVRIQSSGIGNKNIVYTRWGKRTCPGNANLVHSGYAAGSHYTHKGAAVDPLCLPRNPEWGEYIDGHDGSKAFIYGAEYETSGFTSRFNPYQDQDVPCAICLFKKRSVVQMFPGRKTCYKGWNLEYQGYLMAGYHDYPAGTTYNCVDKNPETLHGGRARKFGYLFYFVEAVCGSLK